MMTAIKRSLADLPPPSRAVLPMRPPWQPIAARVLTRSLPVDPGLLSCWRMRGLGPPALPVGWTVGRSLAYRIDAVLDWLAGRRGESLSIETLWRDWFRTETGADIVDPSELRRQAQMLAWAAGPRPGDGVVFTPAGFGAYLESIKTR